MSRSSRKGLILGKFLPPHLGHKFLFDFASSYATDLTIVVEGPPRDPIPAELRLKWVRELAPTASVVHLRDDNPQLPEEHPDFWEIWRTSLLSVAPCPDLLFTSDLYGAKLAQVLGCSWVPVDPPRGHVAVSATKIRDNPSANWQFIPSAVRPYYTKKVVIFGPESTGKSTLARRLAEHFNTSHVSEYARTLLELSDGQCELSDMTKIVRGQIALEDAAARNANRLLFCDTDTLTTTIWSRELFGQPVPELDDVAKARDYYFTLLCDVDLPWIKDSTRLFPDNRKHWFEICKNTLESNARPYALVSGTDEDRFNSALTALRSFDRENANYIGDK